MKNKTKKLSANSQAIYEDRLSKLDKLDIKIDGSMGIRAIVSKFKNHKPEPFADGTIIQYLSAIKWKLENTSVVNYQQKKLIQSLSRKITQLGVKRNKFYDKNILTAKEKEQFIKWSDVLKVYNEVSNNKHLSDNNYLDFVILSLYINNDNGVRRIKDYANMVVSDHIINDDKNHYVKTTKPVFVFNNYKTKEFYGQQKLKVNGQLSKILNDHIKKNEINGSLLGLSEDALKKRLTNVFKRYVDKDISVNILRKSFISNFLSIQHTDAEKKELARTMGHNMMTQSSYNKLNKVKDVDIIPDAPKVVKPGRKQKYDTDEAKFKARQEYLKKWKADNKDKTSKYNKTYYDKE